MNKPFITVSNILLIALLFPFFLLESCSSSRKNTSSIPSVHSSTNSPTLIPISRVSENHVPYRKILTKNVDPNAVVYFAKTLVGTPYKYGSAVKENGFDCSGFITYVFNHFNISVPRTAVEFTNAGANIPFLDSKKGDLILFTGTDKTGWIVGHMGIITENDMGKVRFIHSASGNNKGVMISELSEYFFSRFVKVIRVFSNN